MTRGRLAGVLAGTLVPAMLAFGCHRQRGTPSAPGPDSPPASSARSSDTTARGTVHVVGAVPFPRVVLTADRAASDTTGGPPPISLTLRGPLERELANLDGARVEVSGTIGVGTAVGVGRAGNAPREGDARAISVERYVILEIAGGRPVVGVLTIGRDSVLTVGGVPLSAVPPALRPFVGSTVWVVGRRTEAGAVAVEAYGVLAPPRPD